MTEEDKEKVYIKAYDYLKSWGYDTDLVPAMDSIKEHELCYSINWCEKRELDYHPEHRKRKFIGAGVIFVSKINDMVGAAGSSPFTDWLHEFELKIQNLEEYWVLEIAYE